VAGKALHATSTSFAGITVSSARISVGQPTRTPILRLLIMFLAFWAVLHRLQRAA
jgi:hypothetical protein